MTPDDRGMGRAAIAFAVAPKLTETQQDEPLWRKPRGRHGQRAVRGFVELCASHPELRVVEQLVTSEHIPDGHGDLVMLLIERR